MRGPGREVLQIAMQSYYIVSSSRLSLVRHSKQISKTANAQRAAGKYPLCNYEDHPALSACPQHPRRARDAVLNLPLSPQAHRRTARHTEILQREDQRHLQTSLPRHILSPQLHLPRRTSILQGRQQPHNLDVRTQPQGQTAQLLATSASNIHRESPDNVTGRVASSFSRLPFLWRED